MLNKNDFAEIDFVARVKETDAVFDTTIPEEAEKAGLLHEAEKGRFVPLRACIGQGMLVLGLDKALENKELNKWHEIEVMPKEAFGERDAKLVKIIPLRIFMEKGIMPQAGMMLNLDGMLVRIASVSSGRVITDFNNPLAGRIILYKFRINRKIEDAKDKLQILGDFLLGKAENARIENGKGIVDFFMKVPDEIQKEFAKKVKEVIGIDAEIREAKPEHKEAKKEVGEKAEKLEAGKKSEESKKQEKSQ